jgi:NADPH-dependent 2,4-dienoyl-CoA reductase/sulfur reductase-like enzyme
VGRRLVVVGGVAAGLSAALRARRLDPDLEITVFERTGYCAYSACGLPYLVAGVVREPMALVARTPEDLRARGVQVRVRHEVEALDLEGRRVLVRTPDGLRRSHSFDVLMLATGGAPRTPFPGTGLAGVHTLRTVEDALAICRHISDGARRAVIVGGGYIGLEAAEALVARGLSVTLVEALDHVLPLVDPEVATLVEAEVGRHGVRVVTGSPCVGVEGDGRVRGVATPAGVLPADLVVIGAGVSPESELAAEAGLRLGVRGAVAVDREMRTSVPGVFAGGDCAEAHHLVLGAPAYVPLGTTATKQGRVAGAAIAGRPEAFAGIVGTAVVKVFDLEVGRVGLTLAEARGAGFDAVAAEVVHRSRARYYPGGGSIRVRVVAERGTGRLLGAQLLGVEGVAKRLDVLATALSAGMDVERVASLDLSYAPPFAPVWDPVALAAREAARMAG